MLLFTVETSQLHLAAPDASWRVDDEVDVVFDEFTLVSDVAVDYVNANVNFAPVLPKHCCLSLEGTFLIIQAAL